MTLAQRIEHGPSDQAAAQPQAPAPLRASAPIDLRQLARRPAAPLHAAPLATAAAAAAPAPYAILDLASAAPRPLPAMLRPLSLEPARAPAPMPAPAPEAVPARPNADIALNLLDQVSLALPALVERNNALEVELATTRARAASDIVDAENRVHAAREVAERLTAKVAEIENALAHATQRAQLAEEEVQRLQSTSDDAQRAAAHAECLSSLFENKVIAAFGVGSAGHSILDSVRFAS